VASKYHVFLVDIFYEFPYLFKIIHANRYVFCFKQSVDDFSGKLSTLPEELSIWSEVLREIRKNMKKLRLKRINSDAALPG
jgi:hypothetical protein